MSNDADFYSGLAAGAAGHEDSDVSDADVAALTEALADMDDMDDALFTSSLKNKKSPTRRSDKSDRQEGPTNTQGKRLVGGTRTLSPPSLMNTADSKRGTYTVKEESPPVAGIKTSPRNRPILKKPQTKSFDFGEFDEEDPLAGLLSDDDEGAARNPPKKAQTPQPMVNKDPSPISSPRSPTPDEKKAAPDEDALIPRSKSAPPSRRNQMSKKADGIDFDDDDDILGNMGFDDGPSQKKKEKITVSKDDDEIQAAKSKVADLFGRKPAAATSAAAEKPPAGTTKEFVLDARYKKNEKGKPKKSVDEEDFSFGSYTPSAVNTLQRPDSAPPGRRSVRFADDVDDLFGGTSTLDRPARGASRPRSSPQATTLSTDAAKPVIDSKDEDDDWLSLAIGRKQDNTEGRTGGTSKKEALPGAVGGLKGEKKNTGVVEDGGEEMTRPASAADYLGLGDLDSMLSSKPAAGQSAPGRRDHRSSLSWDNDDAQNTTAGLGSTMDSQLLGGTMSSEGSQDNTQSSGIIARQVAEMDKLEQRASGQHYPPVDRTPSPPPGHHAPPANQVHPPPKQPLGTMDQHPRTSDQLSNSVGRPANSVSRLASHIGQMPPRHGQTTTGGAERVSPGPQLSRVPPTHPDQSLSELPTPQHPAQPGSSYGTPRAGMDGSATLPAGTTTPVSPRGGRKEPQWRQELRVRREQMQELQPSTEIAHQTHSQGGAGNVDFSDPAGHMSLSAAPTPSGVSQQLQEQIEQQQRQAQEMEQALRDQQAQLRVQQAEQMEQMQQLQQEAMQQQLQQQLEMQQQLMQAQTLAPAPSLMPIIQGPSPSTPGGIQGSLTTPGGVRIPVNESKIHQLEDEKTYLETSLRTLQDQHKQQLAAKEKANQDYIKLVEDSFKKKEERWRQEQEEEQRQHQERIDEMMAERGRLVTEHRHELESTTTKHRGDLNQLQQSMQAELRTVSETTGHSRSLQAVMDRVGLVGQELGTLQNKLSGDHQQQLERQRIELEEKDKQLQALQTSLQHQQDEMTGERSRLEAMIQRLEGQLRQQNTQLDQERWRLRQEQTKLSSLQAALDGERKLAAEQTATQQVALQQARESLDTDHQEKMSQCLEERKALATERAHLARERKELDTTVKRHLEKISRENADREGRMTALLEDEKRVAVELEMMERQRQDQAKERKGLERERSEINREQEELRLVAEKLRLRAQQIEQTVQDAVQVRQDGLTALEQSQKMESEQRQREQGIEERLQALRATERQIAQERLRAAEDERRFDLLMKEGLCPSCQRGLISRSGHQEFPLPATARQPDHGSTMISRLTSHPSPLIGIDQVPTKEDFVDHLLDKAEFDHTFSVWRIAADKDKDFLEEESSFLNSLIGPLSSSSRLKSQ